MKIRNILAAALAFAGISAAAQTVDTKALEGFSPSIIKETYEICVLAPVEPAKQVLIAQALEKEDAAAAAMLAENGGFLTAKNKTALTAMRDDALAEILSQEQLEQYYRGIFNAEAVADGVKMRDHVASNMQIGYQDGKFINFCFYKIGLEKRVLAKLMKGQPEKAKKAIDKMTAEQLATLEKKSGLRMTPEGDCTRVRSVAIK